MREQKYGFLDDTALTKRDTANRDILNVFDWEKAAKLIRDRKPKLVEAGLEDDWDYTGGKIYENGDIVPKDKTYTYLASVWCIPKIIIDDEELDCFVVLESENSKWNSGTYWPEEALEILRV